MQELRGSEKIVHWVRTRLTNVNWPFQATVVHRISRSYWKSTTFHGENAGAWNVLKMIALMTGILVVMNIVWHWKLRAAQNLCSGEFNFALSHFKVMAVMLEKRILDLKTWSNHQPILSSNSWPTYEGRLRKRHRDSRQNDARNDKNGNEEADQSLMDSYELSTPQQCRF